LQIEIVKNINQKNVLVAPLDWGLGHATRCIPIIKQLIAQGNKVTIASSGRAGSLLQAEFTDLTYEELPAYDVKYSTSQSLNWVILKQLPRVLKVINQEHDVLKRLIKNHELDIIISDNRYGLHSLMIPCYFITHQLNIKDNKKRAWVEWLMRKISYSYIQKFHECWVPDYEHENNLSGALSHGIEAPFPVKYIGPLSRFKNQWMSLTLEKTYKIVVLISGPEPQRTQFEKIILSHLDKINQPILVLLGKSESNRFVKHSQFIDIVDHLSSERLFNILFNSEIIISRSGYSTIMDLEALGKKAILIPTPGQTEQEYLAGFYNTKKIFFSEPQITFDLHRALKESERYKGFELKF
jgi:uncharacterized protein (TIGR00661 family)